MDNQKSIYDLMDEVRNHPDFVCGILVTADDIQAEIEKLEDRQMNPEFNWRDYRHNLDKQLTNVFMYNADWTEPIIDLLIDHSRNVED